MHGPAPWTPPLPEVAQLQALVRRLEVLQEMRRMELNRRDTAPATLHAGLDEHIAFLGGQIGATQKAIADHIETTPTLRKRSELLATVPGIGAVTAAALLAELADASRFSCARQVAAFAGLDPRLRRALYFPALAALRFNPTVAALRARLLAAGKVKKLIVGAAMRKLLQIAFSVLKSGQPFDAGLCAPVLPINKEQTKEPKLALAA